MCLGGTVKTESKSTSVFSVFIYLYILFAKLAFNLGAGQKEEKAKKFQKYCKVLMLIQWKSLLDPIYQQEEENVYHHQESRIRQIWPSQFHLT